MGDRVTLITGLDIIWMLFSSLFLALGGLTCIYMNTRLMGGIFIGFAFGILICRFTG